MIVSCSFAKLLERLFITIRKLLNTGFLEINKNMGINKITGITAILDKKIFDLKEGYPIGLADGKMGLCIYYYYIGRIFNNTDYKQKAELLIDEVFEQIKMIKILDIKNGLGGIGLGIEYLIENKYVAGDSNHILREIDNELFKNICNLDKLKNDDLYPHLHLIYYFTVRLKKQKKNSENEHLFKETIINTVNYISDKIFRNFTDELISFKIENLSILSLYVLSLCYELHKDKICKILKEISLYALSKIPILHANRLYLLYAMAKLNEKIKLKGWNEHIKLLLQASDIEHIIENELYDEIYFSSGLPAIYFLLSNLSKYFTSEQIHKYNKLIINKIENHPAWNMLLNDEDYLKQRKGLFSGYTGTSILLHKHYKDEKRLN